MMEMNVESEEEKINKDIVKIKQEAEEKIKAKKLRLEKIKIKKITDFTNIAVSFLNKEIALDDFKSYAIKNQFVKEKSKKDKEKV